MLGFVDSHMHIASNMLLRGLLEDVELFEWLATMCGLCASLMAGSAQTHPYPAQTRRMTHGNNRRARSFPPGSLSDPRLPITCSR